MAILFNFRKPKPSSPAKKAAASTKAQKATFAVKAHKKLETWISKLYVVLGQIESALEKGYYTVLGKKGDPPKQIPLDDLKRRELEGEREAVLYEIAKAKKAFQKTHTKVSSIHTKKKSAAKGKRKRFTTNARINKGISKFFPLVKDTITKDTLSSFEELVQYASVQINKDTDFQELEKFFEQNLSDVYEKVNKDPQLASALYKKTVRHIKNIS